MKTLTSKTVETNLNQMYTDKNSVNNQKVNESMKSAINLLRSNIYPNLSDDELIEFNNKFSKFLRF